MHVSRDLRLRQIERSVRATESIRSAAFDRQALINQVPGVRLAQTAPNPTDDSYPDDSAVRNLYWIRFLAAEWTATGAGYIDPSLSIEAHSDDAVALAMQFCPRQYYLPEGCICLVCNVRNRWVIIDAYGVQANRCIANLTADLTSGGSASLTNVGGTDGLDPAGVTSAANPLGYQALSGDAVLIERVVNDGSTPSWQVYAVPDRNPFLP